MTVIKCPKCGSGQFEFKSPKDRFTCSVCNEIITAKILPEFLDDFKDRKDELKKILENVLKEYEEKDDGKNLCSEVGNYVQYLDEPDFAVLWRSFIMNAVALAVKKKDENIQTLLKHHAQDFDKNYQSTTGLFTTILRTYHNIGTNNDWEYLINQTGGDNDKFTALSEIIIHYIVNNQDRAFAIDIFEMLARRANDKNWVDEGRIYIRALFSNAQVADKVFPRSAFNGRTRKFFKEASAYCKKYHNVSVEEMKVGENYLSACKVRKRRTLIAVSGTMAVLAASGIGVFFYLNAVNSSTVSFDIDKVIQTTYGEELDLSGYSVSYRKNSNAECTKEITMGMLSGYDPELIYEQQTVTVKFGGASQNITIRVDPATLAKPVLVQSGSLVAWDYVPNAKDYSVYVNSTAVSALATTSLSCDLKNYENYGELNVTVRANSGSNKYRNSEMSEILQITKLQPPTNIVYEDGNLKWDSVAGATDYDLLINGTPFSSKINQLVMDLQQGDNEVEIHAKSTDGNIIEGITVKNIYYLKLNGITGMTYSNNTVQWTSDSNSNYYSVYVDGEYWKDFTREYFHVNTDGFIDTFGATRHEIGIVCKAYTAGTVPSERISYDIAIGNRITIDGSMLKWSDVGTGALYVVTVNGSSEGIRLSDSYLSIDSVAWETGKNTVELTAVLNNKPVLCETVTIIKNRKPEASISGNSLQVSGTNNAFSVNGGEWLSEIPDISSFTAGNYTIKIKTVSSSEGSLELPSEEIEITVSKLPTPVILIKGGEVVCNYDSSKYALNFYVSESIDETFRPLADLTGIRAAGEYYLKTTLSALGGAEQDADFVVDSDYSEVVKVIKLEVPTIAYTDGEEYVTTSSSGNVKFYYEDKETGAEIELRDGKISNLPKGIFTIYARTLSSADNEISSDKSNSVSVFNMNIGLTVNPIAGNQTQVYMVFTGCTEVDSITYTLEMRYYDADGKQIGSRIDSEKTINKNEALSKENIVTQISYRSGINFESGYSQANIKRVEFIVTITNGSDGQRLSTTMTL